MPGYVLDRIYSKIEDENKPDKDIEIFWYGFKDSVLNYFNSINNKCPIDLNKISIIPSQKEMWILVQKLIIQNKEQQLKIEALERVVHRDIKKINMIDWLNTNIKKSTNFDTWLSKLYTTIDDLKYVFDSDIVRGLERVLINNIEKEKLKNEN